MKPSQLYTVATSLLISGVVLLAAGSAEAAHPFGPGLGTAKVCANPAFGTGQAVDASVEAVASNVPRDALMAASGRVDVDTSSKGCGNYSNLSIAIVERVQIDRLELDYVGSGLHHTYVMTGPVNLGKATAGAQTPGQASIQCNSPLAIRMYFSVRYSSTDVARYSISSGVFYRCRR